MADHFAYTILPGLAKQLDPELKNIISSHSQNTYSVSTDVYNELSAILLQARVFPIHIPSIKILSNRQILVNYDALQDGESVRVYKYHDALEAESGEADVAQEGEMVCGGGLVRCECGPWRLDAPENDDEAETACSGANATTKSDLAYGDQSKTFDKLIQVPVAPSSRDSKLTLLLIN